MSLQRIQQVKSRPKDEKDVKQDTKSTKPKQEDKNIKKDGQDVTKPIKIDINSGVEKQAKQPSSKPSKADPIPKITANKVEAAKSRADLRSKCLKKADGLVRKSLPVILKTQSSQTVKPDKGLSNLRNTPQAPAQPTPEDNNEPKEPIKTTVVGEQTKSPLRLHAKATEVPANNIEPAVKEPQLGDVEEHPLSPADQISPALAATRTRTTQSQSEDVGYGITSVTLLVIPISITIILVICMQKIIDQGDVTPIATLAQGPMWNFAKDEAEVAKMVSKAAKSDEAAKAGIFDDIDTVTIIIFVKLMVAIPLLTVVILCLYKKGYTKCITGYLFVVVFIVLTALTGPSLLVILQGVGVCADIISVMFLLVNYAVLGVIVLFYKGPLLTQQMYQISFSMTIARFMAKALHVALAWTLLGLLVIWDCIAVLPSWGPLRILVETAHERGDTLMPAMIYSTTAVWIPRLLSQRAEKKNRKRCAGVRDTNTSHADNASSTDVLATSDDDGYDDELEIDESRTVNRTVEPTSSQEAILILNDQLTNDYNNFRLSHDGLSSDQNLIVFEQEGINQLHRFQVDLAETNSLDGGLSTSQPHEISPTAGSFEIEKVVNKKIFRIPEQCPNLKFDDRIRHLLLNPDRMSSGKDKKQKDKDEKDKAKTTKADKTEKATNKTKTKKANTMEQETKAKDVKKVEASDKSEDEEKGPKLGLGDFMFYSILVILALDSTDWNMVVACFWCIITGLIGTILILVFKKKPLPALPISLTLGVAMYFGTKFLISPFVDALQENQAFI